MGKNKAGDSIMFVDVETVYSPNDLKCKKCDNHLVDLWESRHYTEGPLMYINKKNDSEIYCENCIESIDPEIKGWASYQLTVTRVEKEKESGGMLKIMKIVFIVVATLCLISLTYSFSEIAQHYSGGLR